MNRCERITTSLLAIAIGFTFNLSELSAAAPSGVKGLGEKGALQSIRIDPLGKDRAVTIRGRDARQQLFISGTYSSGQIRASDRESVRWNRFRR